MVLLHDEDPVGPADVPSSDTDPSIVIRACRAYLIQVVVLEKLLGREAADPILAADEQELLALGHRSMLGVAPCPGLEEVGCPPGDMRIGCGPLGPAPPTYAPKRPHGTLHP